LCLFQSATGTSGIRDILLKCLFFTAPSAFAEHYLEKNTHYYSGITLHIPFLQKAFYSSYQQSAKTNSEL
jgi:hypothetical protein